MRIMFDTSVLIAGFIASHPKHHLALPYLQRAHKNKLDFLISSHSIAECFSVLTRLPLSPRISTGVAISLIKENIEKIAEIISLSTNDYMAVLKDLYDLNLTGDIVYDALIVRAAKKAKAEKILTLNPADFARLTPKQPDWIISP